MEGLWAKPAILRSEAGKIQSMTSAFVPGEPVALPTKALSLLTAAVVVAHLLVLWGTTHSIEATQRDVRGDARPFLTRSVALAPVQPPVTEAPAAVPAAVARTIAAVPSAPRPPKAAPVKNSSTISNSTSSGASSSAASTLNSATTAGATRTDLTTIGPAAAVAASDLPAEPAVAPGEPVAPKSGSATVDTTGATPAVTSASTAAAPVTTAYTIPGSTRLKYNVIATKGSLSFNARAELLWQQDGSAYDARLEVSAFLLGARVQTSTGRLTADGLEPKRFADKFRSEVAAHFERDKRLVTFSANTPQVPLLVGMQDQLSVVMQLSAMVAGAPGQYPPGTEIAFNTIGPRSSENWVLTVGEEEKLLLPGGELQALKLTRKPRGEYDQTLELWLAPQLAYLPARIKLTEKNGDYADQVWRATDAP